MADDDKFTLRPIVVPRSFDGDRIHFAVVFNFDLPGKKDEEIKFPAEFTKWPETVQEQIQKGVFVGVTVGAGQEQENPCRCHLPLVSRST